jgi:hypothetical protein
VIVTTVDAPWRSVRTRSIVAATAAGTAAVSAGTGGATLGVGRAAAVDAGVEHDDRPVELDQLVRRRGLDTRPGGCPDHVDSVDDVVLTLVVDDGLAQRTGLCEQLVEELRGRALDEELGGGRDAGPDDRYVGIDLRGAAADGRCHQHEADGGLGESRLSAPTTQTLTRMRALAKAPTPTW